MKFLLDLGIKEETIDSLPEANFYDLKMNEEKITEIILYLKSMGINNLDELVKEELRILYMDLENIKRAFNIPNKDEIIDLINNDIVTLEEIL